MKRVNKYLIIGAIALVIASCQKQEKKQETIAQKSIEQPAKETFAAPKGIHVTNNEVCMVNNIHMGKKQMEVPFEGKMYYGCCNMCVERISNEESVRTAVDPHTGKKIDKASAYIISLNEEGNVAYFESEENYLNFIKSGS